MASIDCSTEDKRAQRWDGNVNMAMTKVTNKQPIGPEASLTAGANARQIGGDRLSSFLRVVVGLASLIVGQLHLLCVACVLLFQTRRYREKKKERHQQVVNV
jgi:hypothetical protein